jgi:hypothetical protein
MALTALPSTLYLRPPPVRIEWQHINARATLERLAELAAKHNLPSEIIAELSQGIATRLEPILIKYATDDPGRFCIQWDRMSLKRKGFIADRAHASEPGFLGGLRRIGPLRLS